MRSRIRKSLPRSESNYLSEFLLSDIYRTTTSLLRNAAISLDVCLTQKAEAKCCIVRFSLLPHPTDLKLRRRIDISDKVWTEI